jgi:hypothetical protein
MKYYLVALFDRESYLSMEQIQKNICRKYKLYKNTNTLHIALEIIENPDINKLNNVITNILKPYKKFKVETSGLIYFDTPYKSVNLKIESKGYIIRLARNINDTLKLHGFNVRENIDNFDLHVPLANTNYTVRELSNSEYIVACNLDKKNEFYKLAKIERIELWKAINNKKEMFVKSFPLRDY